MISFLLNIFQIAFIDLSMAADNALVLGMAVVALPAAQRKRAMAAGIAAATVLRIILACFAVQLLHITGLLVAGGLLLLWVGWTMARDLHMMRSAKSNDQTPAKKFSHAIWQIVLTDISLSLDNVLGIAGVARDHRPELIIGLVLSVGLMGLASAPIARLTARYPKLFYAGVAVILYTALRMIYDGYISLSPVLA